MKRMIAFFLATCLVLGTIGIALADTYIVNTTNEPLNVRDADDSSIIYGHLHKGAKVNITKTDKYWAYFTYNGHKAKVYKAYLTPAKSSPAPSKQSGTKTTKKAAPKTYELVPASIDEASMIYSVERATYVYSYKTEKAEIIGTLSPGTQVYVRNVGKRWTRIVTNGYFAFVHTKDLEFAGTNLPDDGTLFQVKTANGLSLNVREGADRKEKILARIPNGSYVKVISSDGDWSEVYFGPTESGFVMSKFIKDQEAN